MDGQRGLGAHGAGGFHVMSSSAPVSWGLLGAGAWTAALGWGSTIEQEGLVEGQRMMPGFSEPPPPSLPQMARWDLGPSPRWQPCAHPSRAASPAGPVPTTATLWTFGIALGRCC